MPSGSTIVITYDGTDITSSCIVADCSFEAQMAATPGSFHLEIKDPNRTLSFTTGKEITLDVDGVRLYGGYVLQVSRSYFFPADKTTNLAQVHSRKWILDGADYNSLLDRRVLRDTSDYTHSLDVISNITDGAIVRSHFNTYFDIPSGFNFTSATYIKDNHTYPKWPWLTQGSTMRDVLNELGTWGNVFWIDATKQFNLVPVQDTAADWGFSDRPNNNAIGVGTPTRGYRDGEFTEDASQMVNDAIVWGGSQWAAGGDVVYAREQNSTSISAHGRWQRGEVRVGESQFKTQTGVTARAKAIVSGNESGTYVHGSQGLVNPEEQFRCTWFNTTVPIYGGSPLHLRPGQVVPIVLWVFSADGGTTPFQVTLPLRSMSISFPGSDPTGKAYIQFEGSFGILLSDPKWLWKYLQEGKVQATNIAPVTSASNSDSSVSYGAEYSDVPSPAPNGTITVFTIPFGYVGGTTKLYVNGLLQDPSAYSESDPANGELTLTFAPVSTDELFVEAILSGT